MERQACGLAHYLREVLFHNWKRDRVSLEEKWQRNLDAFNAVSRGKWKVEESEDWRSDTFVNVTKMKVLSAHSLIVDMLLQGGKLPFALLPSSEDRITMEDRPEEEREAIGEAIEDMQHRIEQQFEDCDATAEITKCGMADAIYGEVYAKRYVHAVEKRRFEKVNLAPPGFDDPAGQYVRYEEQVEEKSAPGFRYVSVWDVFRDLEWDDLQRSAGLCERQYMSPYDLRQKVNEPLFIPEAIARVLKESAKDSDSGVPEDLSSQPPHRRGRKNRMRNIEYLEFWCRAPRRLVEEFEEQLGAEDGADIAVEAGDWRLGDDTLGDGDEVEIMACVAGSEVVRFARTEPRERPYYRAFWEWRPDEVGGCGIPDNLEQIQTVLNGAVRAFEDNKKLSANVMAAVKDRYIDDQNDWKPGAKISISEECDDVRQAIQPIIIPDIGESCISVIRLFERYGDMASQVPQIAQGVRPEKSADTAYELSQLLENAGKYLGSVIRNLDNGIIKPLAEDFYRYNMADPDVMTGKGDYTVKPLGFSSFQARVVRLQRIQQFLSLVMSSPELMARVNVDPLLEDAAKGMDFDDEEVLKSPEMRQQEQAQEQEALQMQLQIEAMRKRIDSQAEALLRQLDHQHKMDEQQQRIEGEAIKAALNDYTKMKVELAKMKERINADEYKNAGQGIQGGPDQPRPGGGLGGSRFTGQRGGGGIAGPGPYDPGGAGGGQGREQGFPVSPGFSSGPAMGAGPAR